MPGIFKTQYGSIHYDVCGEGEPVVLVHGTPWSSYTWHKIVPKLAKAHKIYTYDLVGYGCSEMKDGQSVSLDIQTDVFSELLDYWGLKSPKVVAHDFGGAISLRAHLLNGQDFKKLALMNVVAMAPWGSPFFAHVREHEAAFAGVPPYIHEAIVETYIRSALFADLSPDELTLLVSPWLSERGQSAFYRQIAQADQKYTDEVEPLYGSIRCPVQILWGESDDWIPLETGRRLHKAIPRSEFHQITTAGHLVQLENAPEVLSYLTEFLS